MHPYPMCPSCRFPIYKKQKEYNILRAAKFKTADILPEYARLNTSIDMTTKDIFEKLDIKNICCRQHMLTGTYFTYDVYSVIPGMPRDEPVASSNE